MLSQAGAKRKLFNAMLFDFQDLWWNTSLAGVYLSDKSFNLYSSQII